MKAAVCSSRGSWVSIGFVNGTEKGPAQSKQVTQHHQHGVSHTAEHHRTAAAQPGGGGLRVVTRGDEMLCYQHMS